MASINRVVLLGNLTHDPELKSLPSGTSVCELRIAVNDRIKRGDTWEDYAHYFDVTVFGAQAENCDAYLSKGRQVAVDGRLRWRSWEDKDGNKRSKVEVIADTVQFIGPKQDSGQSQQAAAKPASAASDEFGGGEGFDDSDIPFD